MDPNAQQNSQNQPAQGGQPIQNQPPQVPPAPQPQPVPEQPQQAPQPPQAPPAGAPQAGGQPNPQQPPPKGKVAPPPPQTNPNSTQNTLQIAEIRDGIAIMNDGSYRAVVMAKSINFDLMSPEEREAVEYAYQGFLNSLYFPIQIFIRSKKVDMRAYVDKLRKMKSEHENMLVAILMSDYINFIELLAQETNIMDKQFYIAVPYYSDVDAQKAVEQSKRFLTSFFKVNDAPKVVQINANELEKAKTELKNRVQSVMAGLSELGVQSIPLDTEELIELYYDSYNPDTATRQQIQNFGDLTAPIIAKGDGQAPTIDATGETFGGGYTNG